MEGARESEGREVEEEEEGEKDENSNRPVPSVCLKRQIPWRRIFGRIDDADPSVVATSAKGQGEERMILSSQAVVYYRAPDSATCGVPHTSPFDQLNSSGARGLSPLFLDFAPRARGAVRT